MRLPHFAISASRRLKASRTRPPRGKDWLAQQETPPACTVTITIQTERHNFYADIPLDSAKEAYRAMDELPKVINFLNTNSTPMNHLIEWNGQQWELKLAHEYDHRTS